MRPMHATSCPSKVRGHVTHTVHSSPHARRRAKLENRRCMHMCLYSFGPNPTFRAAPARRPIEVRTPERPTSARAVPWPPPDAKAGNAQGCASSFRRATHLAAPAVNLTWSSEQERDAAEKYPSLVRAPQERGEQPQSGPNGEWQWPNEGDVSAGGTRPVSSGP